jgi:hypothetical protein
LDPLVVVVDGDRKDALGVVLADHVLIECAADRLRVEGKAGLHFLRGDSPAVVVENVLAKLDALVADVDSGPGDQLVDLVLALPAEGAAFAVTILAFVQRILGILDLPGELSPRPDLIGSV